MQTATVRWQEWTSFALGLWLAVSPWLADYADHEGATANAAVVGLLLALSSHFQVSLEYSSAEWLNLAVGLWLLAAPFTVGFTAAGVPTANCLAVGTFVTALAASALSLDKEIGKWWHKRFAGH